MFAVVVGGWRGLDDIVDNWGCSWNDGELAEFQA